jgi:hypothetical protein
VSDFPDFFFKYVMSTYIKSTRNANNVKGVDEMATWKTVRTIPIPIGDLTLGQNAALAWVNGQPVIIVREKIDEYQDVTDECSVVFRKSKSSDGYYCAIQHNGKDVLALGIHDISKAVAMRDGVRQGYRLTKAPGAHVSFRVQKLSRD